MKEDFRELTRKQIDEKLSPFRQQGASEVLRRGWVKTIRTALGMSSGALGKRIGITQSAVHQLEASEEADAIRLASLRKLASGLECDLVYALVPRTSLEDIMKEQALRRARSQVEATSTSMELEEQGISDEEKSRQIEATANQLLISPGTGFWNEP